MSSKQEQYSGAWRQILCQLPFSGYSKNKTKVKCCMKNCFFKFDNKVSVYTHIEEYHPDERKHTRSYSKKEKQTNKLNNSTQHVNITSMDVDCKNDIVDKDSHIQIDDYELVIPGENSTQLTCSPFVEKLVKHTKSKLAKVIVKNSLIYIYSK